MPESNFGGRIGQASGEGSGTVTSVSTGTGLTGGPITIAGTISVDFPELISTDIDNALIQGTDDKLFVPEGGGGNTLSYEIPTGDIDGENKEFVFTSPPVFVVFQGVIQEEGTDYTLAASTVTFVVAPASGIVAGLVGTGSSLYETPVGDIDGMNDTFEFSSAPVFVVFQGVIQNIDVDYTLVDSTVTFTVPPASGLVKGLVKT